MSYLKSIETKLDSVLVSCEEIIQHANEYLLNGTNDQKQRAIGMMIAMGKITKNLAECNKTSKDNPMKL